MIGSPQLATQRFQPDGLTAVEVQTARTENGRDGKP